MFEHKTCEKGVSYEDFKGLKYEQRPCFERGGVAPPGCPLAEFPTAEEREARHREDEKRCREIGTARKAIVEFLGGPWKKGTIGASGHIDCPVCIDGTLRFTRSGYNGHIHAGCTTDGCVGWIE